VGAVNASILDSLAGAFKAAAQWCIKNLMTAWLNTPDPDVSSPGSVSGWISGHLWYLTLAAAFASILIASYRIVTTQQWQHGRELAETLMRLVVVTFASATLISAGIAAGDAFTKWILKESDLDFSQTLILEAVSNSGVLLILAVIVVVTQIIQFFLMLVRNGMLVFLAGTLPLLSATTNTATGKQGYQKAIAWTIAFVLYKPVAALLYAGSFKMVQGHNSLTTQLSGVAIMILAVFSLPALMRFLVPATAAMSSGNGGAMAGALVGGAIATGAVLATGGAAAGSGAGFGGGGAATAGGAIGSPPGGSGPPAPGGGGSNPNGQGGNTPSSDPLHPSGNSPSDSDGGSPGPGASQAGGGLSEPATARPAPSGSTRAGWQDVNQAVNTSLNASKAARDGASGAVGEET